MAFTFTLYMSTLIKPKNIFIVIPVYNEQEVIVTVINNLLPYNYSLVVVDDGSENNPELLLHRLPVFLLRHRVNLGQGAALQTGIEFALTENAEFIVTFDGDNQHDPKDIDKLLTSLIDSKADIAIGSRFMKGAVHNIPVTRKLLLQLARWLNYFFTGLLLTDAHNGLRVLTAKAAKHIQFKETGMAHATEILSLIKKNKLRYIEVPVTITYSAYSLKKGQSMGNSFRIFFDLLLNKIFR